MHAVRSAGAGAFWCLLEACLFSAPMPNAADVTPFRGPSRGAHHADLGYDDDGRLIFTQLQSETAAREAAEVMSKTGHSDLYHVAVNFDIEDMDASLGMTMVFDKVNHHMRLDPHVSPVDGLAWGRYDDRIDTTGWSELYVEASPSQGVSNDVKMYSAGFVEGLLTCVRLSQYYANTHQLVLKDEAGKHSLANLRGLFKNELAFMKAKANIVPHVMTEEPKEAYWQHSRYVLFQMWGVVDGYNFAADHFGVHSLTLEDMLLINSGGELPDLMMAYTPLAVADRAAKAAPPTVSFLQKSLGRGPKRKPDAIPANATKEDPLDDAHWEKKIVESGRCSAFVRVTEGAADLLVGHTTWNDYSAMTRVFKYYKFPLSGAETMAFHLAFSSYPGLVSSSDDFYITDSGLSVFDTSLEMLDMYIWDKVTDFPYKPHIPNFVHIMITNRLAKNAVHWARIFTSMNTGTYNSQWMIVDYKQFTPGKEVRDNTFWLVETMPGLTHMEDLSHFLRKFHFWPSFNRPYFQVIRDASGHSAAQRTHGALYSWTDNPRAKIFGAQAKNVETLFDMRALMSHNMYPYAGVEPNEPGHEISARMDLSPTQPIPNGGIDAKVTSRCLMKVMAVQAISGPTHANQPAFRWTKDGGMDKFPGFPHVGQPDVWNFDFVQMTPASSGILTDIIDC